jgi:hypothetical protein
MVTMPVLLAASPLAQMWGAARAESAMEVDDDGNGDESYSESGAENEDPAGAVGDTFLLFLAHCMAYLPFDNDIGPLTICYHINRIIALNSIAKAARSLLKQLKSHYRSTYKLSSTRVESFLPHKVCRADYCLSGFSNCI